MNWKDPKVELPEEGKTVWVIYGKQSSFRSCQMMCGIVEYSRDLKFCRVNSEDFTGSGNWSVLLIPDSDFKKYAGEVAIGWIDSKEFKFPLWLFPNGSEKVEKKD